MRSASFVFHLPGTAVRLSMKNYTPARKFAWEYEESGLSEMLMLEEKPDLAPVTDDR